MQFKLCIWEALITYLQPLSSYRPQEKHRSSTCHRLILCPHLLPQDDPWREAKTEEENLVNNTTLLEDLRIVKWLCFYQTVTPKCLPVLSNHIMSIICTEGKHLYRTQFSLAKCCLQGSNRLQGKINNTVAIKLISKIDRCLWSKAFDDKQQANMRINSRHLSHRMCSQSMPLKKGCACSSPIPVLPRRVSGSHISLERKSNEQRQQRRELKKEHIWDPNSASISISCETRQQTPHSTKKYSSPNKYILCPTKCHCSSPATQTHVWTSYLRHEFYSWCSFCFPP